MIDKSNKRLDYLDMAKGVAIICVMLGHIMTTNQFKVWICSFHVVLFFIISGCLLNYTNATNKDVKLFIKNKIRTIILPYFIFSIIYVILNYMILGFNTESLKWNIIYTLIMYGCGALWFLPTLFIAEISLLLIYKILKNKISIIISVMLLVAISFGITLFKYNIIMLIVIRGIIALGFLTIGYYSFNYIKELNINNLILIALIGISFILSQMNGMVDLWQLKFNNIFLYLIVSLSGSLSIILILKNFSSIKILNYFGINSLILMCTHQNIMELIKKASGYSFEGYISSILLLIVILIIEIPIIYIINNYLSFMIGNFSKKKNVQTVTD